MPGRSSVAAGQFGAVGQHCVDQRAPRMARRRVDDHACRLVYHQQRLVFVHDVQRDRLGGQFVRFHVGQMDHHQVAGTDLVAGFDQLRR